MKRTTTLTLMTLVVALLAGCNQAKTPGAVQDEADAQRGQSTDLARRDDTEDRAAESMGVPPKSQADINYDMAISSAETAHRAAVERCQALAASEQPACRDRADADLEMARQSAQATRDAALPPPATPPTP